MNIKSYLTLLGLGFSVLSFGQNSLLLSPTTGALPDGVITDIELCGNGIDQVLVAACEDNKEFYVIDIDDNDWGDAAANTITEIPDFSDVLEAACGITNEKIANIEVNRISKAVYVLVQTLTETESYIVKIEDNGATVSVLDESDLTYSTISWGSAQYGHQDMTWGDNTLFITSGSWTLDGAVGQVSAPFEHGTSTTNRSTSMFKTNWGGAYYTDAPLERIEFANMNGESRLMGVTVCAPGFSIETSELDGGGILEIEELFNVRFSPPEKVVHQNQGGTHYLFDLHSPNQLIRIGEEYIDGSKIGTGEFNFGVEHLRTTGGTITPGLTEDQAKLYPEDFSHIAFWDDYNLLVVDSDVLKLFPTGTAVAGLDDVNGVEATISPNPASEFVNFSLNMTNESAVLNVYDISGKSVLSTSVTNGQNQIDTQALPAGTYVLKVTANDTELYSDKLIIK